MGHSQAGTARFSNLLALAIIVLVLLLLLSVLADELVPRRYLHSPFVAEFCIGQRVVLSNIPIVWLQGIWLTAPPMPVVRQTANGTEYNQAGTVCGLLPWLSGSPGFWYRAVRP